MKELKEALGFAIELGEASIKAASDGKFDWTDALEFRRAAFMAGDAINGIHKIPGEVAAMDEAKKAELVAWVKKEFDIPQDGLEEKVEGAISIALGIAMYAATFGVKKDA